MLDLDTCRRLMEAYPEDVGGHRTKAGDMYYSKRTIRSWDGGEWKGPVFEGQADGWGDAWHAKDGDVWCPRLEDLLDISGRLNQDGGDNECELSGQPGRWQFGCVAYVDWITDPYYCEPEEAVSAWLLAVAERRART